MKLNFQLNNIILYIIKADYILSCSSKDQQDDIKILLKRVLESSYSSLLSSSVLKAFENCMADFYLSRYNRVAMSICRIFIGMKDNGAAYDSVRTVVMFLQKYLYRDKFEDHSFIGIPTEILSMYAACAQVSFFNLLVSV